MKPKDLKYPHSFEERKPTIHEGVLFIPKHYYLHHEWKMPELASTQIFGNKNPVYVEYCSGNGQWICEKARENPHINWIGVEMRFDRIRKIWAKKNNMGLNNLFLVCGEAQPFTKYYLKDNVVDAVFVNFPDPWPKEKHSQNRLLQNPFISDLSLVVTPKGIVTVVTDDEVYSQQVIEEMLRSELWQSRYQDPFYLNQWPEGDYGTSFFEELWRAKGKMIRYMQFINKK